MIQSEVPLDDPTFGVDQEARHHVLELTLGTLAEFDVLLQVSGVIDWCSNLLFTATIQVFSTFDQSPSATTQEDE